MIARFKICVNVCTREYSVCSRIVWIDGERFFKQAPGLVNVCDRAFAEAMPIGFGATKIIIVGLPSRGWLQKRSVRFSLGHMSGKNSSNRARDFILNAEHIAQLSVISLGPAVSPSYSIDELRIDANA